MQKINILKVHEKNCYSKSPTKLEGSTENKACDCVHVCTVLGSDLKLKEILLKSSDIYKQLGSDSPNHIKEIYT